MNRQISYWQPRVMRHVGGEKSEEFAIHEVYFDENDLIITYTDDALSPRMASLQDLKTFLQTCMEREVDEIKMGDSQYTYSREDIEYWLSLIDEPPIEYI